MEAGRRIVELAKRYQNDAVRIDTIGRNEPHRDIEYRAVRVAPNEVEHAVVNLLRFFEAPGALVFANTRESVRSLHAKLRERGFAVVDGLLPAALAYGLWNYGLRELGPTQASVFLYFSPVVAVASEALLLGTTPGPLAWVGGGVALVGVILVQRARAQRPPST